MNYVNIPDVSGWIDANIAALSQQMDTLEKHAMASQPWPRYRTDDSASFTIAHQRDKLLVKYYVREKQFSALIREVNGAVHKDNCVELFIKLNDHEGYYNLEFNCLGSAKIAYGKNKTSRTMLPENLIKQIDTHITLDFKLVENTGALVWSILLNIPKALFMYSSVKCFSGLKAKANFHKCVDGITLPHFLTWANILSAEPDFHQPAYFGDLSFA